jgi:hypothetical protein
LFVGDENNKGDKYGYYSNDGKVSFDEGESEFCVVLFVFKD